MPAPANAYSAPNGDRQTRPALWSVLLAELSDDDLDQLAALLAPRIAARIDHDEGAGGYLDVAGAAEFLACSTSRIYGLVSARRIPHYKDGSRLLFDCAELRAFVAAGGARCP